MEGKAFVGIFGACTMSLVGKVCKERKHCLVINVESSGEGVPSLGVQGQVKGRIFFL